MLQHHHQVHTGVNFRMVFRTLRHTPQGIHLRQQHPQSAAIPQHLQHARGVGLHQTSRYFGPHPLWHQGRSFTRADHLTHQHGGRRGYVEVREAGRKAGQAQDANRIFSKGVGAMAQGRCAQVSDAAQGIHHVRGLEAAIGTDVCGGNRHRVDGQVTPAQVLLQGDRCVGLHHKAPVTGPRLALSTGQCIFLAGMGVQKHRKIAAHRLVASIQHGLRAAANHNPVTVPHRQAHQGIAHCATDQVGLHGQIMGPARATPQV